jgi:hypothetical protein
MEDIANILTIGILIGVGLAFVPMVIGIAVGGILKILNKL